MNVLLALIAPLSASSWRPPDPDVMLWTADGGALIAGTEDGDLLVYGADGALRRTLRSDREAAVEDLALSADDQQIAGRWGETWWEWDLQTGEPLRAGFERPVQPRVDERLASAILDEEATYQSRRPRRSARTERVTHSAGGRVVEAVEDSGVGNRAIERRATVYDAGSRALVADFAASRVHPGAFLLSPAGTHLAVRAADGAQIRALDDEVFLDRDRVGEPVAAALRDDGALLAAIAGSQVLVWDVESGASWRAPVDAPEPTALAWRGGELVVGTARGEIASADRRYFEDRKRRSVLAVRAVEDGGLIAVLETGEVLRTTGGEAMEIVSPSLDDELYGASISPDGRHALLYSGDAPRRSRDESEAKHTAILWHAEDEPLALEGLSDRIAWAGDALLVGVGERAHLRSLTDGARIRGWRGDAQGLLPGDLVTEIAAGVCLTAPAEGRVLDAAGGAMAVLESSGLSLYDAGTGERLQHLAGPGLRVEILAETSDRLITQGGGISIWDRATGEPVWRGPGRRAVVLGERAFVASEERVAVLSLADGAVEREHAAGFDPRGIELISGGRLVVAWGLAEAAVFDPEGRLLLTERLKGPMRLSPDGRWLATRGRIVDLETLATVEVEGASRYMAWLPDSSALVIADSAAPALVDPRTGLRTRGLQEVRGELSELWFDGDALYGESRVREDRFPETRRWAWDLETGRASASDVERPRSARDARRRSGAVELELWQFDDAAWLSLTQGGALRGRDPGGHIRYLEAGESRWPASSDWRAPSGARAECSPLRAPLLRATGAGCASAPRSSLRPGIAWLLVALAMFRRRAQIEPNTPTTVS